MTSTAENAIKRQAAIVRRAAEWASNPRFPSHYRETIEPLRRLARDIEDGIIDASTLPDDPRSPWSSVLVWAEEHGRAVQ